MNKLLIIYNICELKPKRDNSLNYQKILSTLFSQSIINDCKIVISGCKVSNNTKKILENYFKDKVSYNWIEDAINVNVTFNLSVLESIKNFGEFEGYLYLDSGTIITNNNGLELIYNKLQNNSNIGILSVLPDKDSGLEWWFNIKDTDTENKNSLFYNGDLTMPVGHAVNCICCIFSKKFQQFYHKLIPDIFNGYCVESTFSFICAAINTHWIVTNDINIIHYHAMDGGSQCSDPIGWKNSGQKDYDHPFIINSIIDRVDNLTARKLGLGYEECQKIVMHDKSKYDENGFAIESELKTYIKNNLYLQDTEYNYNNINFTWIH